MRDVLSCDTAVITAPATVDGSTIFAKNSDRKANECQPLFHAPRRSHRPGATVRAQYLEIPQVATTWEVTGSRPWWLWGFEIGVNEHGVAIGNEAVYGRDGFETDAALIGMDLVRLGLERGATAEEALGWITLLLERHGQGGNCDLEDPRTYHNSFIVADPREAWILETSGRNWAAQRVRGRGSISNLLSLRGPLDRVSQGLVAHAQVEGWPVGTPFDFAATYIDPTVDLGPRLCRLERSGALLAGQPELAGVDEMIALLRDHSGADLPAAPRPFPTLCMHSMPNPAGETAAAMVAHLRPDRPALLASTVWHAFGSPCLSVFRPLYPRLVGIDPALNAGGASFDTASAWWRHERVQRLAALDPAAAAGLREPMRALEASFRREAAQVEESAAARLERDGEPAAAALLRTFVDDTTRRTDELMETLWRDIAPAALRSADPTMLAHWDELNARVGLVIPASVTP